jgi:chorismate dehydratase
MPKKIGIVKYLKAEPLVYGLRDKRIMHPYELVSEQPSVLADHLQYGMLDLALIPVVEYARSHEFYAIYPEICIGASGPVQSVLLFFNRNVEEIKTVALDKASRTSMALAKILIKEKFELDPRFVEMPGEVDKMLEVADAALLIGDKALTARAKYNTFFDLAEEWVDWTGLPFVFAVWAGRRQNWTQSSLRILHKSREMGIASTPQIADIYARNAGGDPDFYRNYLDNVIDYQLTEKHIEGLKAFFELAFYHNLIDNIPDIIYFPES